MFKSISEPLNQILHISISTKTIKMNMLYVIIEKLIQAVLVSYDNIAEVNIYGI